MNGWVIIDRSIRGKSDANKRTELVQKQRDVRSRAAESMERDDEAAVSVGKEMTAPATVDTTSRDISQPSEEAPIEPPAPAEPLTEEQPDAASGGAVTDEPPPAEVVSGPRYAVHVASFRDIARAGREKEYFEKKGYTVSILAKDIKGEEWFRICIGEYPTREEAARVRAELMDLPNVGYTQIIELKERK